MEQLRVELIPAQCPQVKGRVERMNGTLQDRRVKTMRLEGISDIECLSLVYKTITVRLLRDKSLALSQSFNMSGEGGRAGCSTQPGTWRRYGERS